MQTKKHLPLHFAGLALIALLYQAEAQAHVVKKEDGMRRVKARFRGHRKFKAGVGKRQQSAARPRARMRQRAALYEPYIAAAARKYGVDPRVLWTIAYLETRFRPDQVSPKGARGLMQFIPGTAKRFNLSNPHDAIEAIDAAARFVALLTKQFNGRLDLVLASYNSGETAVDCYLNGRTVRTQNGKLINPRGIRTGGVPPYSETQSYVRRGVLVFSRVTSAAVFPPELVASTRMLHSPPMTIPVSEQAGVERELYELGGSSVAVLYSANVASNNPVRRPATLSPAASQTYETVFFDVHSGVRYLVKSGQIVKPLEAASEIQSSEDDGHKEVAKSVYLGSRE